MRHILARTQLAGSAADRQSGILRHAQSSNVLLPGMRLAAYGLLVRHNHITQMRTVAIRMKCALTASAVVLTEHLLLSINRRQLRALLR